MPGEIVLQSSQQGVQFPEATFLHNIDKPFEIHRVHLDTTGLNNEDPRQIVSPPLADTNKFIRVRIDDTTKNEKMTKNAHLVNTLIFENTRVWDWEDPYTVVRSEGFQITLDAQDLTTLAGVDALRVEVTLQGYLIVIGAPTETR